MRTFILIAALVAVVSAAIVKRDAPATGDADLSKLVDDVLKKFHKVADTVVDGTLVQNVWQNTTTLFSDAIANVDKQMKDVAPEVKAQLGKAQDDMKKAIEKFKESNGNIGTFTEQLEKVLTDAKNNDYIQKLTETIQKLNTQATALVESTKSKVTGAGN